MKSTFILFVLLGQSLLCFNATAQIVVDRFKKYDIKNSSCEVFNSVNAELERSASRDKFRELIIAEQNKYPFQTQNNVDGYIKEFELVLDNTKKQYEAQEFLWKTGKELGKYGLSALGNYAQALPTKYLTNFLTPAIQQGFDLYVDNEISKGIEKHNNEIDELIKSRVNLLFSNGVDITKVTDEASFAAMFQLAHKDIPAMNRGEYIIFTNELTKRAYDYIAQNRDAIKLINLKLSNQYNDVNKETNKKLDIFQKGITANVNAELKQLAQSISDLSDNQKIVFEKLDKIQDRVLTTEKAIRKIEQDMAVVKGDVNLLKVKQEEHSRLLAQNSFQIDILSGYAFQNLNTTNKINALKSGNFDNIFSAEQKSNLISELEVIKNKETIISVAVTVENYSHGAYSVLTASGLLKGKDAQVVGKLMYGISIASGVARVFAGDFSGFVSIVSGLGGIFGKPQKSPEVQMMEQMYEAMNIRFDIVDQKLNIIDVKLDSLSSQIFHLNKNMVLSFQYTIEQIDKVNRKVDYLNNKASYLIFRDYNNCEDQYDIWNKSNVPFLTYSDITSNYNPICEKCLDGLSDFLAGRNIQAPFFFASNPKFIPGDIIDAEINDVYTPTKKLFIEFYADQLKLGTYSLMYPFSLTNKANLPAYYIGKHNIIDKLEALNASDVLNNYYNHRLINEVVVYLLKFSVFYETQDNNSDYKPQTLVKYLTNVQVNKNNRDLQELRLLKLLNLVQYSISQQSLLAGNMMLDPIYNTLFATASSASQVNLSISVLNNNKLLASNFATYIINNNINFDNKKYMDKLFTEALTDVDKLNNLNKLFAINSDVKFIVDSMDKRMYIEFYRADKKIKILCPPFDILVDNKMINSEAMYELLESRNAINSKLIDLTFTKKINNDIISKKFKYIYQTSK